MTNTVITEPKIKIGVATRWFNDRDELETYCKYKGFGKCHFIEHIARFENKTNAKAYAREVWSDLLQGYQQVYLLVLSLNEYTAPFMEIIPNLKTLKYEDLRFTGSTIY